MDGKQALVAQNENISGFENVKVYAGDPWYPAADAKIKNFYIGCKANEQSNRAGELKTRPKD